MSEPSIDPNWLQTAWQWVAGLFAALWGGWRYADSKLDAIHKKIDGKADKEDMETTLARVDKTNEHIEKLYSNAESDRSFVRDLHERAMESVHSSHREIMSAIADIQRRCLK